MKKIFLFQVVLAVAVLSLATIADASTIYDSSGFGHAGHLRVTGNPGDVDEIGAKFTPSGDFTTTDVTFYLAEQGSPADDMLVSIEGDSSGVPDGTPQCTATVANGELSPSETQYTKSISGCSLTSGTQYWVVFHRSTDTDTGNYVYVSGNNNSGGDGSAWYKDSSWQAWNGGNSAYWIVLTGDETGGGGGGGGGSGTTTAGTSTTQVFDYGEVYANGFFLFWIAAAFIVYVTRPRI